MREGCRTLRVSGEDRCWRRVEGGGGGLREGCRTLRVSGEDRCWRRVEGGGGGIERGVQDSESVRRG